MDDRIKQFFANSICLDYFVLRPLSHINLNWELTWDGNLQEYTREDGTFAALLMDLIDELACTDPPAKYHENEDKLAEYVVENLNWSIYHVGTRWVGADYEAILEQGGFHDVNEKELVMAAAGRIIAALRYRQYHFDDMEESHRKMLAAVLSIILYHRDNLKR